MEDSSPPFWRAATASNVSSWRSVSGLRQMASAPRVTVFPDWGGADDLFGNWSLPSLLYDHLGHRGSGRVTAGCRARLMRRRAGMDLVLRLAGSRHQSANCSPAERGRPRHDTAADRLGAFGPTGSDPESARASSESDRGIREHLRVSTRRNDIQPRLLAALHRVDCLRLGQGAQRVLPRAPDSG